MMTIKVIIIIIIIPSLPTLEGDDHQGP